MSKCNRYLIPVVISLLLLSGLFGCSTANPPHQVAPNTDEVNLPTIRIAAAEEAEQPTEETTLIGCDPVTGRAQEVNLCWEQLCVADRYDIEVAKDPDFSILVIDWTTEAVCGGLTPEDVTQPCAYIPAGGVASILEGSAIAAAGNLECGHTYYWRVRARRCATGQWLRSPWSEVMSFTVKAGLPVNTPYYGPQLLSPDNGCVGCPVKPVSFSWSPFKETTKYQFLLAKDAEMTQIVVEAEVSTTAYEYDGTLEYDTNYFWRVRALEPAPSDGVLPSASRPRRHRHRR